MGSQTTLWPTLLWMKNGMSLSWVYFNSHATCVMIYLCRDEIEIPMDVCALGKVRDLFCILPNRSTDPNRHNPNSSLQCQTLIIVQNQQFCSKSSLTVTITMKYGQKIPVTSWISHRRPYFPVHLLSWLSRETSALAPSMSSSLNTVLLFTV